MFLRREGENRGKRQEEGTGRQRPGLGNGKNQQYEREGREKELSHRIPSATCVPHRDVLQNHESGPLRSSARNGTEGAVTNPLPAQGAYCRDGAGAGTMDAGSGQLPSYGGQLGTASSGGG